MGRDREENLDQATEQMTEVVQKSYQSIAEGAVALQERNVQFSQIFFETWTRRSGHKRRPTATRHKPLRSRSRGSRKLLE